MHCRRQAKPRFAGGALRGPFGGSLSVHEFFAKIARFAVSKGAAFCYAVTVGVSGQLAYNYLAPKDPAPAATSVVAPAPPAATSVVAAPAAPAPPATAAPAASGPAPSPTPVSATASPAKPPPAKPVATAPILPDPPAAVLPNPSALAAPALRPVALPPSAPLAAPSEGPAKPDSVAKPDSTARPEAPAMLPVALGAPAASPLPPLGAAIDVAPPPTPRSSAAAAAAAPASAAPASELDKRQPWQLSDIWHPGRAVEKGLGWAGDQLPLIGGAAAETPSRAALPAGPIPLLPPAAIAAAPGAEKAVVPVRPGPGSGGLY